MNDVPHVIIWIMAAVYAVIIIVAWAATSSDRAREDRRTRKICDDMIKRRRWMEIQEVSRHKPGTAERYHAGRKLRGDSK